MNILLILLDILIYNLTPYNSYFFLIVLMLIDKKDYLKILLIGLFLDFIILDKFLINTIILLAIFLINKKLLKIKNRSIKNFIFINLFNFLLYVFLSIMVTKYINITKLFESLILQTIFLVVSYNFFRKHIKLNR